MKCHGCGHEFPTALKRCPRCHRSASRLIRTSSDSRLLEFPRRPRAATPAESTAPPLPAWRVELNEKVRAIKARRDASGQLDTQIEEAAIAAPPAPRSSVAPPPSHESRASFGNDSLRFGANRIAGEPQPAASGATIKRSSNNIVEAALVRVKRASENASRAALPKIEPARSIQGRGVDREATARALAPAIEIESRADYVPIPIPDTKPEVAEPPIIRSAPKPVQTVERRYIEPRVSEEPATLDPGLDEAVEFSSLPVIDEIEPLDYLEAEIRRVDKTHGADFLRNESPSVITHAMIGAVDLLALALSCAPFLAIVRIVDGSFSSAQTRVSTIAVLLLVSFFYLALTQWLCGRTFGMMLTNTRVVDSTTFGPPSPSRALIRTVGYFLAAAPAMLGILWTAFDHKHRGWQDIVSGTLVVRDF